MKNTIEKQVAYMWGELPAKWRYIAIDGDGMIYAYTDRPQKSGRVWELIKGEYRRLQRVTFDELYTRPEVPDCMADQLPEGAKNQPQ